LPAGNRGFPELQASQEKKARQESPVLLIGSTKRAHLLTNIGRESKGNPAHFLKNHPAFAFNEMYFRWKDFL